MARLEGILSTCIGKTPGGGHRGYSSARKEFADTIALPEDMTWLWPRLKSL
jgi:hypothetical protein